MTRYDYLIIGGGMTGDAAAKAIRETDARGSIGMISSEPHPPYARPPLSKALWKGEAPTKAIREPDARGSIGMIPSEPHPPYARPPLSKALWKGEPEDAIWKHTETATVDLLLDRRVTAIDPVKKSVADDRGNSVSYQKLLLATGGTPRRLSLQSDQIIYYRTYDDYRRLRALAERKVKFLVLGGGFIGSEVGAALRMVGCDVTMLIPEDGIGARVFPADLSRFLVEYYR